jgi:NAD(P)-dependent dehydrogenase (short-subunit alcohol dehydrogenase family)
MPADFKDKVVLVTGAGSGIGREAARLYAARGAHVFGADLNEAGLAETEDIIRSAGWSIDIRKTDVSREADVKALIGHVEQSAGRLDIAFNNAGLPEAPIVSRSIRSRTSTGSSPSICVAFFSA